MAAAEQLPLPWTVLAGAAVDPVPPRPNPLKWRRAKGTLGTLWAPSRAEPTHIREVLMTDKLLEGAELAFDDDRERRVFEQCEPMPCVKCQTADLMEVKQRVEVEATKPWRWDGRAWRCGACGLWGYPVAMHPGNLEAEYRRKG